MHLREEIADYIDEIIDISVEQNKILSEKLQQISSKHNAVLMAFIASYVGRKVSPTKTVNAQNGSFMNLP
jgi:ribosomal protein S17E